MEVRLPSEKSSAFFEFFLIKKNCVRVRASQKHFFALKESPNTKQQLSQVKIEPSTPAAFGSGKFGASLFSFRILL